MSKLPVRLTSTEISQLIQALQPFLMNIPAQLYLYGSRTQQDKHGGDIDLLLVVSSEQQQKQLLYDKHMLLVALKNAVGDQKIDLCITTQETIPQDPFLTSIWPQTVLLYKFEGLS